MGRLCRIDFVIFDRANFMTLAASLIGTTSLIFNAKGNPVGQALMIVFSLLYGHFEKYSSMSAVRCLRRESCSFDEKIFTHDGFRQKRPPLSCKIEPSIALRMARNDAKRKREGGESPGNATKSSEQLNIEPKNT